MSCFACLLFDVPIFVRFLYLGIYCTDLYVLLFSIYFYYYNVKISYTGINLFKNGLFGDWLNINLQIEFETLQALILSCKDLPHACNFEWIFSFHVFISPLIFTLEFTYQVKKAITVLQMCSHTRWSLHALAKWWNHSQSGETG